MPVLDQAIKCIGKISRMSYQNIINWFFYLQPIFIMQIPCILFFCVLAVLTTLEVASGTCEGDALSKCSGNYVSGFTSTSNHLDDVSLHCKLDRVSHILATSSLLYYCFILANFLLCLLHIYTSEKYVTIKTDGKGQRTQKTK